MDITAVLYGAPSVSVADPVTTERAQYLEPDGTTSETMAGPSGRPSAKGDPAMTAGALALFALAGLVAMRYAFRGALK